MLFREVEDRFSSHQHKDSGPIPNSRAIPYIVVPPMSAVVGRDIEELPQRPQIVHLVVEWSPSHRPFPSGIETTNGTRGDAGLRSYPMGFVDDDTIPHEIEQTRPNSSIVLLTGSYDLPISFVLVSFRFFHVLLPHDLVDRYDGESVSRTNSVVQCFFTMSAVVQEHVSVLGGSMGQNFVSPLHQ
jgi:hypothetical protein